MTGASARRASVAVAVLAAAMSCVFPHRMERTGPVGTSCPSIAERRAVTAPPDTTLLRWYRSQDDRSVGRGGDVCEEVGAPVFVGQPAGDFPDFSVGDSLTVLSWNADGSDGNLSGILQSELNLACEGERSRLQAGAPGFIALVQDVARTPVTTLVGVTTGLVPVAERCGLALHFVASRSTGGTDRGDAILSTLPLTIPVAIELPVEVARAVTVAATVVLPGGERLRVASAHVDGRSSLSRSLVGGGQTRARQVAGLIDGLDRADDEGPLNSATLLGASLGVWDDRESAVRLLEDAFPESPAWDGRKTKGSFSSDHVFFRREGARTVSVGRYERLEERYGSAHYGRRVTLNYFPARVPESP